jgi:hypothetical protein
MPASPWRGARERGLGEPSGDGLREAERATVGGIAAEPGRVLRRGRALGPVRAEPSRILWMSYREEEDEMPLIQFTVDVVLW